MKSMSISEFMQDKKPTDFRGKFNRHMKKYGFVYKVIGTTIIIFVAGGGLDYASASTGIDVAARGLYKELVRVGKWIIIFKGGMDTIKSIGNGDFDAAKKSFFSYLLVYLLLLGLPYGMDKVDQVFNGLREV